MGIAGTAGNDMNGVDAIGRSPSQIVNELLTHRAELKDCGLW